MHTRRTICIAATVLLTATGILGSSAVANANATGCHDHLCINVPGHDSYVGKVRVSYTLPPRDEVEGAFYIMRNNKVVHHDAYRDLKNESHINAHTWSDAYTFDRNLKSGDRICGKFAEGDYTYSEACETVG
jgi:hypothetical protein